MTAFAFGVTTTNSFAQEKKPEKKIEKFGEDKRFKEWKGKKWTTSDKKFTWRASDPWGGLLFHDFLVHFADSVRAASGGRLDIKVFQTGAIVPAMETFDAVSKGTLDCGHAWSGYWKGKNEAFVAKARVTPKARAGLVVGLSVWWKKLGTDGKNANEVTSQRLTDMGRAPTFYDTLVQVEQAAPAGGNETP
jgi:hypothetical protein